MKQKDYLALRVAIADYIASDGCSCCQDVPKHQDAAARIGQLLGVPRYSDDSGYDFAKLREAARGAVSKIPWAMHSACHAAHVRAWPQGARVWVRWGTMGWRPGVVRTHRDIRVGVQVVDGLWPFDGSRLSGRPTKMTWKAPSSLRARKNDTPPTENANSAPSCVVLSVLYEEGRAP